MSRSESPADTQITRSFVAVVAGLVLAGGMLCERGPLPGLRLVPQEFRALAMVIFGGTGLLRGDG